MKYDFILIDFYYTEAQIIIIDDTSKSSMAKGAQPNPPVIEKICKTRLKCGKNFEWPLEVLMRLHNQHNRSSIIKIEEYNKGASPATMVKCGSFINSNYQIFYHD